tara:strand:- start:225 stop:1163 length:939 start_codon:yes stop_codon:yes gene_type:complete
MAVFIFTNKAGTWPMDTHSTRLPSLSQLGDTGVSVSHTGKLGRFPQTFEKHNVPGDGSCLYHCLLELRHLSGGWIHPDTPDPQDVDTLRSMMGSYLREHYENEFVREYTDAYFIASLKRLGHRRLEKMEPMHLVELYIDTYIRKEGEWGGALEVDIACRMFQVIIHVFEERTANNPSTDAKMVASYYPTDEMDDKGRTVTKWLIVLGKDHYKYATPKLPHGLKNGTTAPPHVPKRNARDTHRCGKKVKNDSALNRVVHDLTTEQEEDADEARGSDQASVDLARQLQKEEEENYNQIQSDGGLAKQLANLFGW